MLPVPKLKVKTPDRITKRQRCSPTPSNPRQEQMSLHVAVETAKARTP